MRLTPKQKEFIDSLYDPREDENSSWECFGSEMRTALSLEKKGLVAFHEDDRPEKGDQYFEAKLTKAGLEVAKKFPPKHSGKAIFK